MAQTTEINNEEGKKKKCVRMSSTYIPDACEHGRPRPFVAGPRESQAEAQARSGDDVGVGLPDCLSVHHRRELLGEGLVEPLVLGRDHLGDLANYLGRNTARRRKREGGGVACAAGGGGRRNGVGGEQSKAGMHAHGRAVSCMREVFDAKLVRLTLIELFSNSSVFRRRDLLFLGW